MIVAAASPVSVKLDQDTRACIERLAASRRRTAHWIMREAIGQYVEREEKRESFRQAGIDAWHAYQADGRHLTQADADKWLAKLETGKDAALQIPPVPRQPPAQFTAYTS